MKDTKYVLSLSYGKDSLACLEAIKQLGLPLDRIIHAEVWATDTIPADLPPMVEFKKKADKIIKERYGIEVEHIYAVEREREKLSYSKQFYKERNNRQFGKCIYGFPCQRYPWCNSKLKVQVLDRIAKTDLRENILSSDEAKQEREREFTASLCSKETGVRAISNNRLCDKMDSVLYRGTQMYGFPGLAKMGRAAWCTGELKIRGFSNSSLAQGADTNIVQYLGIAADEPERIERHKGKPGIVLPLVDIGWDEAYCRKWCEENDLLSPIYTDSTRGGCWFCHNQSVGQLRLLRKNYPDLWELLLKWDNDSPVSFRPDGRTVHDFDKRFELEEKGIVPVDRKFRWKMLNPDK